MSEKKVSVYIQENFRHGKEKYTPGKVYSLPKEAAERALSSGAGIEPNKVNVGTSTGVVSFVQYEALKQELEEAKKALETSLEGQTGQSKGVGIGFIDELTDSTLNGLSKDLEIEGYSKMNKKEKAEAIKKILG